MARNRIHVLPEYVANKIAAGEVVDRPASVVKELVENALDAGARQIDIIVKGGGKLLVQVIDDGCGMSPEDASLAFQRHSTSKIATAADLESITTLGFRGEALASIASVARVELRTAEPGASESTVVRVEGATIVEVGKEAFRQGTSVAVKNLFYNTPARRKFLRADETEYRHILTVLSRFTLAFPEVGFSLINGDTEVFSLTPAPMEARVAAVLGGHLASAMVPVEDKSSAIRIYGMVAKPEAARKSRGDQYLFLNRRYVVDRALNHAVLSGYGESLPRGLYPSYVLFLELDPRRVDVNVHPTKTEVKLADAQLAYELLRGAVRRALTRRAEASTRSDGGRVIVPHMPRAQTMPRSLELFSSPSSLGDTTQIQQSPQPIQLQSGLVPQAVDRPSVWQFHDTYILSEVKSGLVIIDQHAAHERILFEQAMRNLGSSRPASQQLLFPQTVELSAEQYELLTEMLPFLEMLGFVIRSFGRQTVVVEGVPSGYRGGDEARLLIEVIDEYRENRRSGIEMRESVARSYACHAAIRAGERLSVEAMHALIDQLFATENPYYCPHGRPTVVNLSLEELARRFQRQ
ncbi:MAG: DNA mismatch repair endonuclease MutL [candidate division KSB1 bacterium]|nr:DNA mismatch repair endonuclease MutL [candidate division KSB1 bacterium]MDZ7392462.1 DNA mismatch repair endonuclease MutL [candidate division KSB1 bacterium]MDZ7412249.1 DNA mismatch repair endonuclease MutL [candidate division KSB1 bacterium]